MIIRHRSLQLLREATTIKRVAKIKEVSFETKISEEEDLSLLDLIDEGEALWHEPMCNDAETLSLQHIDIIKIRGSLPEKLQEVFDLMLSHSVSEAAQILKIPRTTMSSRVAVLRGYLLQSTFREYFIKK